MKMYIVLMRNGTIYSVRKSKKDAEKDKARLETTYEHAAIREYDAYLHRKGYRKASDVADEIVAGIEAAIEEKALTEYHRGYIDALRDMAEAIKRKYTEGKGYGA